MRYRFAGPQPYYFPASRDSHGIPLGDVNPGDERDLDEPVGPWWVPADDTPPPAPWVTQPAPEPADPAVIP